MTPNPLYQALVEALESQLPPRVVSMVLREGMGPAGVDPENMTLEAAIAVLRGPAFRQLQASKRSTDAARAAVSEIKAYLEGQAAASARDAEPPEAAPPGDGASPVEAPVDASGPPRALQVPPDGPHAAAIEELRAALRPFNLYFSWPEVRKLRSLVQLAETESGAGHDPGSLLAEAETQLRLVEQKHEDQLVLQARTLADLEAALEAVTPLGTAAVRRLDALLATVRESHDRRTLVEAEVERAEKLARELRKLVESTVLDDEVGLPDLGRGDGRPSAPPLVHPTRPDDAVPGSGPAASVEGDTRPAAEALDRLRALDLEGEVRDLEALAARHAELLQHLPALTAGLAELRAEHGAGRTVGERLSRLERDWGRQAEAHRQALRLEFEALRDELERLPTEVDTVDLRHALTVAFDVLNEDLPGVEDVATVRELHAAAIARREEIRGRERERAARRRDQREQLAAIHRRLRAACDEAAGDARLEDARGHLLAVLDPPPSDGDLDERGSALLEVALDAEAAWERAVAEASDDRTARWRARTRELGARLAQLPDLPGLRARAAAVRQEIDQAESTGVADEPQLTSLTHLVEQLTAEARTEVARRLEQIAREAGEPAPGPREAGEPTPEPREPAPEPLLRALQAAARQLDDGGFPDLEAVERLARETRDGRHAATRRRYLRARQEARRLADAGVPAAAGLPDLVADARAALQLDDGGEGAVELLERQLAETRRQLDRRLAGFGRRVDTALVAFRAVARLNNDEVAAVRRVLHHLDGQRDAIGRVSPGLQGRMFEALADAERQLDGLGAALEATRAIAGQLVAGNRLDDLLGSFDALFGEEDAATADAGAPLGRAVPEPGERRGAGELPVATDEVAAWLDRYLASEDVDGAVVLTPRGQVLAGRVPVGVAPSAVAEALGATLGAWTALGNGFGDGPPDLALLEVEGRPAWVAPLAEQGCAMVVWSRHAEAGDGLAARLRDERPQLSQLLRAAVPKEARCSPGGADVLGSGGR